MLNNKKGELIRFCYESKGTDICQHIIELFELLLDETRRKNDDASHEDVYRNQGEIRTYKILLSFFNKKSPEIS